MSLWRTSVAILKRIWLFIIFLAITVYLVQQAPALVDDIQQLALEQLLVALLLLTVGKFALVLISIVSVQDTPWQPTFHDMLTVNSYSQLAKYLPGGVWHFVSRAGYYQSRELTLKATSRAIIIENIWLVISAFFLGTLLFSTIYIPITAVGFIFIAWVICTWLLLRWTEQNLTIMRLLRIALIQSLVWLPLGLSYTIILPIELKPEAILISSSGFILSWLIGYVSVFAPGGIGVREIALIGIMIVLMPPELSLSYVALHRGLWVLVELLLALLVFFSSRYQAIKHRPSNVV
jgi:hypothetical protein